MGRTFDGTLVPVQPMIEPLFETFNELEILARLAGESVTDGYSIAQATFAELGGSDFNKFLSDGVLDGSAYNRASPVLDYLQVASVIKSDELKAFELSADQLEVRFAPSSHAYDGRFANNGWMMECPDPITKLTWDNAIQISPSLARELESTQGIQIFPSKKPMNKKSDFFEGLRGRCKPTRRISVVVRKTQWWLS